jgi:glutathione S-transferase
VLIHETGLSDRIQLVEVASTSSPVNPTHELIAENPLGKIPTLVLNNGNVIFDSRVISEYLDTLHDGPPMFPPVGITRWRVLTRQALADGILDAAVLTRYELMLRPEQYQWPEWIDGQKQKFRRALDSLECDANTMHDGVDIGAISTACALAYLDFRYPDESWHGRCPRLAAWYEKFVVRMSMRATRPE